MVKVVTTAPLDAADAVREAMAKAGAGVVGNYTSCSFSFAGTGRFRPEEGAEPAIGAVGQLESVDEERIEFVVPRSIASSVVEAARAAHPYEEVIFDIYPLISVEDLPGPAPVSADGLVQAESPSDRASALMKRWWRRHAEDAYGTAAVQDWEDAGAYERSFVFMKHDDAGEPIGVTTGKVSMGLGYVHELIVDPAHRGRGVGGRLLAAAEQRCAELGARRLALRTDGGGAARSFYERRGWVVEHESPDWFAGATYVQMRKDLG